MGEVVVGGFWEGCNGDFGGVGFRYICVTMFLRRFLR